MPCHGRRRGTMAEATTMEETIRHLMGPLLRTWLQGGTLICQPIIIHYGEGSRQYLCPSVYSNIRGASYHTVGLHFDCICTENQFANKSMGLAKIQDHH